MAEMAAFALMEEEEEENFGVTMRDCRGDGRK